MKHIKTVSVILGILLTTGILLHSVDKHFAKAATQEIIRENLDIAQQDITITRQQMDIHNYKNLVELQKKVGPCTTAELTIIAREEEKLEEMKQERINIIENRGKR